MNDKSLSKAEFVAMIDKDDYRNACEWAWKTAATTGDGKDDPKAQPDLIYVIVDTIWPVMGSTSRLEDVQLTLDIYEDMPCYPFLSQIHLFYESMDEATHSEIWRRFRKYLAGESNELAGPVCYSLWCDYFEDLRQVDEAWNQLILSEPNDLTIERILPVSGPVPFDMKLALYNHLLPNPKWHSFIFRSLLWSAFDYFGKIENEQAKAVLARLKFPEDILPVDLENLELLKGKLNESPSITTH